MADPKLEKTIAAVVRQVIEEESKQATTPAKRVIAEDTLPTPTKKTPSKKAPVLYSRPPMVQTSPLPGLARLAHPEGLTPIKLSTPARVGVGRSGLRYPTDVYMTLRADHAIAKDAVASTPSPEFLKKLGVIELHTQTKELETFLLEPEKGRALSDESLKVLRSQGTKGADVQIIFADGLSAWAAEINSDLLPHLQRELQNAGFSVGTPLWVHRARIAVADQIGVELGAKATLICLGERPGLGTGDSLSIYLAWGPKLGQDNAEKNCISNVRPAGFSPAAAAKQAVDLLTRARQSGKGGLALGAPQRTF
jgi:ethanolamine ammonia-lyase small subunit